MASFTAATRSTASHIPDLYSVSYRSPTETVKENVMLKYGGVCWLCESPFEDIVPLQVAHNVNASIENAKVEKWRSMGIVPSDFYPAHHMNLILLCLTCYAAYDSPYPMWVALPEDLGFFVEFEREDYEARIQAAANGIFQTRSLPPVDPDGILCRPYFFNHSNKRRPLPAMNWCLFPKRYFGYPQTLILKALHGCFFPAIPEHIVDDHGNEINAGVPPEISDQIYELVKLWSRPDPQVEVTGSKRKRGADDDSEGSDEDGKKDRKGGSKGKRISRPQTSTQTARRLNRLQQIKQETESALPGPSRSDFIYDWLEHTDDITSPISPPASEILGAMSRASGNGATEHNGNDDRRSIAIGHWAVGPHKTAMDEISEVARYRHLRELDSENRKKREEARRKESETKEPRNGLGA
ncbi:hypothetical protein AJ79_10280 [Helicocarpus griseus UAMH5409]|uniref:Uncharacterized protein n=1 Tax=Helicocarpus griseus UAMH5409 TaxID=1447875 RepID=A0A2B7WEN2_9EURO|nr:hypothetical protein AJ79_10280 [Helicocarpus griseus UAMH5409]